MAVIKFNQIAQASGKVNGTIYATGIGGQYMKTWKKPANPESAFQVSVRGQLSNLASGWRGLTQAQRDAWANATESYPTRNRFGDLYIPSGYQLYMTLNGNLNAIGGDLITEPAVPVAFTATGLDAVTITNTAGVTTEFAIDPLAAGTADERFLAEVSGSVSTGISSPKSVVFKSLASWAATGGSSDEFAAYVSRFGNAVLGAKVFIKLYIVNITTGQRQSLGSTSTIVVGT